MFGINSKRKKGSITDIFIVGVILTFIAISTLVGFKIMDTVNDQIQGMDIIPQDAKTSSTKLNNVIPGTVDNTFLFMEIFLSIVILVLAAMVRIHPIFIPLFMIALVGLIIFAAVFSNVYQEAASTDQLQPYADQMPVMTYTLVYLPTIMAVLGTILMVVMYKSWRDAQF